MSIIPDTVSDYRKRHRKTKSIRWAVKYYNDNYKYTEWDKPPGRYEKTNGDKRKGFRRKNRVLQLMVNS